MAKKDHVAALKSHWDGRLATLIGTALLCLLAFVLFAGLGAGIAYALGAFDPEAEQTMKIIGFVAIGIFALIGYTWALVIFMKWDAKNTVISGQRLRFTASTFNLFFNLIKWSFLIVITLGIYSLWLPIKVRKWQVEHTVSEPDEEEEDDTGYAQPVINYYYEGEDDEYEAYEDEE